MIQFRVYGKPEGQPRARARRVGNHARVYNPHCDWKRTVAATAIEYRPNEPMLGPVRVDIVLWFARPKSHFGTGRNAGVLKASAPEHHTSKPDRDNCEKAILDVLTELGFWRDDAQVCAGEVVKKWGEHGGAALRIEPLNGATQ